MGMFLVLAAMSMVHDAAHGVYARQNWINEMLLHFTNLAGGDGYMYKYKHTVSHHPYTNIHGLDIDLEQSGIVRVTPYTRSAHRHRYQDKYMKVLYPFYILFWVLLRDFKYYQMKEIGLTKPKHSIVRWIVLLLSKIFYIGYMVVLPCWFLPYSVPLTFTGFMCMQVGSGIVAMFALLSNHVVEDSVFITPDVDGGIPYTWGEHQMRTTDDYSPDSTVISYLFSGLNHHVAHHLFPRYCHVHYPTITKIVRETAAEFGIRYRYNSITGGLMSHFRLLRKLSRQKQTVSY
jgi:linoleoyl-CoA desaturase